MMATVWQGWCLLMRCSMQPTDLLSPVLAHTQQIFPEQKTSATLHLFLPKQMRVFPSFSSWIAGKACEHLVLQRCVHDHSLSRAQLFATPWTAATQAPPSMGLSRQEYWNGLPFPPPGDLSDPGFKPQSPALQADSLPLSHQGRFARVPGSNQGSPFLWLPGNFQSFGVAPGHGAS